MDAPPTRRDAGDECDSPCCRPRDRAWKPADAARGAQRYPVREFAGFRPAHGYRAGTRPARVYRVTVNRLHPVSREVIDRVVVRIPSSGPHTARVDALHFCFRQLGWRVCQAPSVGEAVR